MSSTTFSPSPGNSSTRIRLTAISRLRSSFLKNLPEPLRRAVADCLSSTPTYLNDPPRTLRDYLAAPATTDLAYSAILEHTIAERERSPAVVTRCVALLKRYLLRYKPSEETLLQIDRFCSTIIAECDVNLNQPWSQSLNQQYGASPLPVSSFASEAIVKSLCYVRSLVAQHIPKRLFQPASFAGSPSASGQSLPTLSSLLRKSFNSQLCPGSVPETLEKDSIASLVSKSSKIKIIDEKDELGFIAHDVLQWRWLVEHQSSSMPAENDRSVNSQDMRAHDFLEVGAAALLVGDIETKMKGQPHNFFGTDDMPYLDQLLHSSPVTAITNSASARPHLRAIAASKRTKAGPHQVWGDSPVSTFRPRARQLFQYRHYSEQQPLRLHHAEVCEVIAAVCSETSSPNTNVATVSARLSNNSGKPSMDVAVSVLIKLVIDMYVFNSRTATPLTLSMLEEMLSSSKTACRVRAFDLILNLGVHAHLLEPIIADYASTIEEEYSQESFYDSDTQLMSQGSRKGNSHNKLDTLSPIDKLESWILNILYEILLFLVQFLDITRASTNPDSCQSEQQGRESIHYQLFNATAFQRLVMIFSRHSILDFVFDFVFYEVTYIQMGLWERRVEELGTIYFKDGLPCKMLDLYKRLESLTFALTEEMEESVWASALSCLLYFVCDRGKIRRNRMQVLDIRVIKILIETSRRNCWAELVHCKLISMLANMFYEVPDEVGEPLPTTPKFLVNQLDLIGGVQFLFREYSLANSREERSNLYSLLFDYVLHQINETCIAMGVNEYSYDEIQPLAALLAQANAAEAFYISVKLGVEGIGGLLRRSIASALSRYPNSERLNALLEIVTDKFDAIISSFTHLYEEFSNMIQITKSHQSLENMEGFALGNDIGLQAKHSWATLHSLLHSERIAYRQNGHIWLGELLIAEISGERGGTIWSNIEYFQQKIAQVGKQDSSDSSDTSDTPLPISLMCGLLKSKHNYIRWGFLFVLERLLLRCKFLLDEYEMQQSRNSDLGREQKDWHLEKAHAMIDIMSSSLCLVFQINETDCINKYETDRINILKVCDILFSQLCLRVPPTLAPPCGDDMQHDRNSNCLNTNKKFDGDNRVLKQATFHLDEYNEEEADRRSNSPSSYHLDHETASMAALLLQGQAIVPMQLIARVPADLLYWPLMQLAGEATDDIALGVAVGSKGRGNLPGATSDIRATLLLLFIGKCMADPVAFLEVGQEQFFRQLLDDTDSRVAYFSSAFLLKRMMTEKPEKYQHMLQNVVVKAQQSNNEKLLENPYLQMRGILQLANDLGFDL